MSGSGAGTVRLAHVEDAPAIGRLLHDFNTEFDEATPGPGPLAQRMGELITSGETVVLLAGSGPDGLAVLRFRPAIWSPGLDCYLAELYVRPERRARGIGSALLAESLVVARSRGADAIEVGVDETDEVARHLYEHFGFSRFVSGVAGSTMFVYERPLSPAGPGSPTDDAPVELA